MVRTGAIVTPSHYSRPDQTLAALDEFLSAETGRRVNIRDLIIIATVAEMVQFLFGVVPN